MTTATPNAHEVAARLLKVQAMAAEIIKDAVANHEDIFARAFLDKLTAVEDGWWELVAQKAKVKPPSEETILGVQEFFARLQRKTEGYIR